ncbi:MAG: hypothetical protein ACHQ1D_09450 [Nitrososphaerales archaeon]
MAVRQINSRTNNEVVASILKSVIKGAISLKDYDWLRLIIQNLRKLKVLMEDNMIKYDPRARISS